MARTLDEVKQEYSNICVRAGNTQYQIHVLTKDLTLLNKTLEDLNFEAAKIQAETTDTALTTVEATNA